MVWRVERWFERREGELRERRFWGVCAAGAGGHYWREGFAVRFEGGGRWEGWWWGDVRVLALQANNAESFHPSMFLQLAKKKGHNCISTYASALSKLSLKTAVTARSISKLSVANARIFCAACVVALAVGEPLAVVCLACLLKEEEGEDALDAGRERGEGPASPGPYVYGALADALPRLRPFSFFTSTVLVPLAVLVIVLAAA